MITTLLGRIGLIAATASTMVAMLTISTPTPPAAAAEFAFTHLQYNICGRSPSCPNRGGSAVVRSIGETIARDRPNTRSASFNEICDGQVYWLRDTLRAYSTDWHVWHIPTAGTCPDGTNYGNAIAWKGDFVWRGTYYLPNESGEERRAMGCMEFTNPARLTICAVHINHRLRSLKNAQITYVRDKLADLTASGRQMVVGGDFNLSPSDSIMTKMYSPSFGGTGQYREGCGSRYGCPATNDSGSKLDYTFMNGNHFIPNWHDVVPSGYSDHHQVWSNLTLVY